ncbi:hypothetical protein [Alloalcanivorax gelatiniphagus]|uniref:Uncharacterized protein n=1 Tax=Alloalcanivorax gelatiniphagus TaxID=1194167 RepID=A0ABY2XLH6_9GAMM|nr:hypothetical protein [Alloalcanivorax gelatiniphagus]TMW12386.1 hypothetical protein FGS76_10740 [Alloalcanivorax gelatiniphagus]
MHEPSEINDQLTDDRIDAVGRLLVEAHNGVIEREEPFDNGWSIGTRSHTWRMGRIVQAVERSELPWLSLIDGSLKFIFAIGDTPVNMFHGTTGKPKKNILSRAVSYPELQQLGLFEDLEGIPNLVWSYALETGPEGEVVSLQFVGLTDYGQVVAQREVPIDGMLAPIAGVAAEDYEPVSLPAAPVTVRRTPKTETGEEQAESRGSEGIEDSGG